jgi:hypothetical protein
LLSDCTIVFAAKKENKKYMSEKFYFGIFLILFSLSFEIFPIEKKEEWTWVVVEKFGKENEEKFFDQNETCIIEKTKLPHFNHLIFSWNAVRPEKGYLRFSVRVRDAFSQVWHKWHIAADWGAMIQKSYVDKPETGPQWHYVRLEMPIGVSADAFSLKIVGLSGASVRVLKSVLVSLSALSKFSPDDYQAIAKLPSLAVVGVPAYSQMVLDHPKANVMCSTTSCSMLTAFLTEKDVDPLAFALSSYDNGLSAYGSWPFNIAHMFEKLNHIRSVHVLRLPSFTTLYKFLKKNIPVVVSVRGAIEGAVKSYDSGHLLLVIGWSKEKQKVLCHDPAFPSSEFVPVEYDLTSFCIAWERSRRLAYCVDF